MLADTHCGRSAPITGCRTALRHWKAKDVIPLSEWLGEMNEMASYEQLDFQVE